MAVMRLEKDRHGLVPSEQRAVIEANRLEASLRLRHGIVMKPKAQLALYHWIKNGRAACPGGECCKEDE